MAKFYLTTAIDYANGDPHLGHAFEKIGADAIARYRRLRGDDVWFLIGMDEHGQKVAQTAAERGLSPQALTDQVAVRFQEMWARLGISHDQFMRTTAPQHRDAVRELIERIFRRNPDDFYEKAYAGRYCVGCESFKQDAEIVDGRCALHPTRTLEWVEERNWFFRLSRYQEFLARHIEAHPEFIQPATRRNEILGLLRQGLDDVSASRARFGWGVPFPRPTSDGEAQTTYVWFDALPNYWTATRFPGSRATWPAQLHVIGKDITRFHCVIWPAMLQAAGLPLPERVWAHGFITYGGERFSKSAGVRLELAEAVDRFGADAFRYFLLREVPWDADGSFSWERFEERYTADLADGLGNLASRALAMVEKYRGGVLPTGEATTLDGDGERAVADYQRAMDVLDLQGGAAAAWSHVAAANLFVQQSAPWTLAKEGRDAELDAVLGALGRSLYRLAILVAPFMPGKAQALWEALGQAGEVTRIPSPWFRASWGPGKLAWPGGAQVQKPAGLFPKPAPTGSAP
ncbi:MAG TPA: methionine--tRNA ligase [Gemmatimonadales bacterium]|nr:methionine--tRNA ligase [Gemmatimonadales bacterium]